MNLRILISVVVFGIGAVVIGWIYESSLKSKVSGAELIIPDNIDYFLTRFKFHATNEDGDLDYRFSGPRLEHRPSTDVSHLESPSLQIFRDHEEWQIDSGEGLFQHRDNLLKLQHNVIMQKIGDDPMQLTTDSIQFEPDRDLVTIASKLRLLSRNAEIEADQAVFNLADKIYSLQKARAIYTDDKS